MLRSSKESHNKGNLCLVLRNIGKSYQYLHLEILALFSYLIKYIDYIFQMKSMKFAMLLITLLLAGLASSQTITRNILLPIETTQGVRTEYSIKFATDTQVPHSAKVVIAFPFEFDPRNLIYNTGCKFKRGQGELASHDCSLSMRSFTLNVDYIDEEPITIVIGGI